MPINFEKENMRQLNRYERHFKKIYQDNPELKLDEPCDRNDIMDILHYSDGTNPDVSDITRQRTIEEPSFIKEGNDIAFVKHLRYLPAYWHTHAFFEVLYVISGNGKSTMEDQELELQTGDICIFAPGTSHALAVFSDETIVMNILVRKSTFEKAFFGFLETDDILSTFFTRVFYHPGEIPYLLFHTENDHVLEDCMWRAYTEYQHSSRYQRQMLNALLSEFFVLLYRHHENHLEVPLSQSVRNNHILIYLLHYMQANYQTVTLSELAHFFNYSERQIQRIIRSATGMSFSENIQHQQMRIATELLTKSSLSISEICEQTGFHSVNNFRKLFLKHYGMTPSAYRKEQSS